MINVTEILQDLDFSTNFTVLRCTGMWYDGEFLLSIPQKLEYWFPVHPANEKDLQQIAEGDRLSEILIFYCVYPKSFNLTRTAEELDGEYSDMVLYKGNIYKIIKVKDWITHGWQRAYGIYIRTAKGEDYV